MLKYPVWITRAGRRPAWHSTAIGLLYGRIFLRIFLAKFNRNFAQCPSTSHRRAKWTTRRATERQPAHHILWSVRADQHSPNVSQTQLLFSMRLWEVNEFLFVIISTTIYLHFFDALMRRKKRLYMKFGVRVKNAPAEWFSTAIIRQKVNLFVIK